MRDDQKIENGDDREGKKKREKSIGDKPIQVQFFMTTIVGIALDQRGTIDTPENNEDRNDEIMNEMNLLLNEDTQGETNSDETLGGELGSETGG